MGELERIMARLLWLEESKIMGGISTYEWEITTEVKEYKFRQPAIAVTVINDGADDIYVRINEMKGSITDEAPFKMNESHTINATYPTIHKIYIVSEGTSTVRLIVEEGRFNVE